MGQALFNYHGLGANSYPICSVPCSRPPAKWGKKAPDLPVDAGWCCGRHRPLRTEFRLFYVKFLGDFQCILLEQYSILRFHGISIFSHQYEFILPIKEAVTPSKKEKKKVCLYMIRGCTPYAALCVLHIIHACSVHCCQLLCHVCIIL